MSGPVSVVQVFRALEKTGRPTAAHLITGAAKGGGVGGQSCAALRVVAWWCLALGVRSDRDEWDAAGAPGALCGRRTRPVPLWPGGNCVQGSGSHPSRRRLCPRRLPLAGIVFLEQIEEDEVRCKLIRPASCFFPALVLSLGSCGLPTAQAPDCCAWVPIVPLGDACPFISPALARLAPAAGRSLVLASAATGETPSAPAASPEPPGHLGQPPPPDRSCLGRVHPPLATLPRATGTLRVPDQTISFAVS